MPCLLAAIAFFFPRFVLFILFLTTTYLGRAFEHNFWPFMGFIFMPCTTLAYAAAMNENNRQLSGFWLAVFILGVLIDIGVFSSPKYVRRPSGFGAFRSMPADESPRRRHVRNEAE